MKKIALAAVIPLGLAACADFTMPLDFDACAQALINANSTKASVLVQVAASTPACVRLEKAAVDKLIAYLATKK